MSNGQETAILAEAGLRKVKELLTVLAGAGIEAHIARPPAASNT